MTGVVAPQPHVDVLGPVTVHGAAGPVELTRPMEIGVLGLLALHAGSPVTGQSLIDALWPDDPPRTAGKTLQGYVKRVRAAVAANGIELTHAGRTGYVLRLAPTQVDANRFESLVAHARTSPDDAERRRRLDDALALWRGQPFAGCELDGVRPHRDWLLRLYSGTRVERVAAQIRLGVTADTIASIRALLVEEPTNERLWLHLAGALYLFGNPVAALEAITEARRELVDRVGVSLGPELSELQRHLLDHDDVERCYFRLTGEDLPVPGSSSPGPAVRAAAPMPLPAWGGEVIGRDDVIAEVAAAIDAGSPLITITGPGGMGKTRCAAEAARRAQTPCAGFLDLSALTNGPELALHLAGSFGVPDRDDPVAAVAAQLKGARVSVVLDNVEQIEGAARVVDALAARCPSVVWVVTSQIALDLASERVVRLRPIDDASSLLRAAARRRGVTLPDDAAVERIASSIGGIPLALELAACQLQYLEASTLLSSLEDPLGTLVDPHQPVGRHRSMRACFELGLARLGEDATDLLALTSHRPNGCRYDDLAAAWSRPTPFAQAVAELVELGFAAVEPDLSGAARLTQLPVVRAFGRTVSPDRDRPADLEALESALDLAVFSRAQASLTATRASVVEPDLPDIRRLLQRGLDDPAAHAQALQLAVLLTVYWWSARITEGRRWLAALLDGPAGAPGGGADSPLRPYAVHSAAFLDFYVGDAEAARDRLDLQLKDDVPDPTAHARLLALRAMLDAAQGAHALARERVEQAILLARQGGDDQTLWFSLGNAGDVAVAGGDPETARLRYVECLERLRRTGLDWLSAAPHARLGDLELSAGEFRRARMWLERSISLWSSRELGPGAPQTLAAIGRLDALEGDTESARRHLDTALATAERCGSRGEYPWIALGYAALMAACGRRDDSAVLFGLGLWHGPRAGHCVSRLVEAELAGPYRWAVGDPRPDTPPWADDPWVTATRLEDLPTLIGKIVTA